MEKYFENAYLQINNFISHTILISILFQFLLKNKILQIRGVQNEKRQQELSIVSLSGDDHRGVLAGVGEEAPEDED
jgi:hypothetical protein